MKDLFSYIQEEMGSLATPANTVGMGNPGVSGDNMSEPLVIKKTSAHNNKSRLKGLKKRKSSL